MAGDIELRGLDPLITKLETLGRGTFVGAVLDALALYLKGKVATYPPANRPKRKAVYGQTFKTDQQRRGFFAKLAKGEIEVPYRRGSSPGSETLGRKWTIAARGDYSRVIGNNVSYGRLVQSRADQTLYMRAVGWQTTEDVAEAEERNVVEQGEKLLAREIEKVGG